MTMHETEGWLLDARTAWIALAVLGGRGPPPRLVALAAARRHPIRFVRAGRSSDRRNGRQAPAPSTLALAAARSPPGRSASTRPSATFEFVNYDDNLYVVENAHITQGLSWDNVLWSYDRLARTATGIR
jgi:hypothetical protein